MKTVINVILAVLVIAGILMVFGCGGTGHVTVGVGVAGPWYGPYPPAGGIWVGRPIHPYYLPLFPL